MDTKVIQKYKYEDFERLIKTQTSQYASEFGDGEGLEKLKDFLYLLLQRGLAFKAKVKTWDFYTRFWSLIDKFSREKLARCLKAPEFITLLRVIRTDESSFEEFLLLDKTT